MPTRGRGERRECPVGGPGISGCGSTVRAGYLMCPYHWRQVTPELQRAVWTAWRTWGKTYTPEAWSVYTEARSAALNSVERKP